MKKNKIYITIFFLALLYTSYTISYSVFSSVDISNNNYIQIGNIKNLNTAEYKCLIFQYNYDVSDENRNKWLVDVGYDKIDSILNNTNTNFPDIVNVKKSKTLPITSRLLLLINSENLLIKNKNSIKINESYVEIQIGERNERIPLISRNLKSTAFTYQKNKLENFSYLYREDSILLDLRTYNHIGYFVGNCSFKIYVNNNLYDQFKINFIN